MMKLGEHVVPYAPVGSRTRRQMRRKWAETDKHISFLLQSALVDPDDQAFLDFMDTVIPKQDIPSPPAGKVVQQVIGEQQAQTARMIYKPIGWASKGIKVCRCFEFTFSSFLIFIVDYKAVWNSSTYLISPIVNIVSL